jgi:hypothetical protein
MKRWSKSPFAEKSQPLTQQHLGSAASGRGFGCCWVVPLNGDFPDRGALGGVIRHGGHFI